MVRVWTVARRCRRAAHTLTQHQHGVIRTRTDTFVPRAGGSGWELQPAAESATQHQPPNYRRGALAALCGVPVPQLPGVDSADALAVHLLPRGWETSVPPNYLRYARWSAAGSIVSSASMVLSTQSLLYGLGLGAASVPAGVALNW